jgi:hypothetical protein
MKISRIIYTLSIAIVLSSCATSKLTEQGNVAYKSGNYESALSNYDQLIESKESSGKKAKATVYMNAGKAALELEQTDKARKYLETAKELQFSSEDLYVSLAEIYKTIDNLSKEITALEIYREKYPQGKFIQSVTSRLFETYVESMNWDLAVELWPAVEETAQSDVNLLAGYLTVNKNLNNEKMADQLADQLFKLDKNNVAALEYYAEKYFWRAENLYTTEMNAYNKNRTSKQYKQLLAALDKVWPDFQKSRDYFLRLYKIDPKPEYAKYLGNIYTRYKDEKKAQYYYKRAN